MTIEDEQIKILGDASADIPENRNFLLQCGEHFAEASKGLLVLIKADLNNEKNRNFLLQANLKLGYVDWHVAKILINLVQAGLDCPVNRDTLMHHAENAICIAKEIQKTTKHKPFLLTQAMFDGIIQRFAAESSSDDEAYVSPKHADEPSKSRCIPYSPRLFSAANIVLLDREEKNIQVRLER